MYTPDIARTRLELPPCPARCSCTFPPDPALLLLVHVKSTARYCTPIARFSRELCGAGRAVMEESGVLDALARGSLWIDHTSTDPEEPPRYSKLTVRPWRDSDRDQPMDTLSSLESQMECGSIGAIVPPLRARMCKHSLMGWNTAPVLMLGSPSLSFALHWGCDSCFPPCTAG